MNEVVDHITGEPIGIRVLGDVDPRDMTREEFEASSDLLFHGSKQPMIFSCDFDYSAQFYLLENDNSATLGIGFYTTPNSDEAANYSAVRQDVRQGANAADAVYILQIMPYSARVLDLRDMGDPSENAPVPIELVKKWRDRYVASLETNPPPSGDSLGAIAIRTLSIDYVDYLDRAIAFGNVNLRQLLQTAPCPKLNGGAFPFPPWIGLFSQFMREEGYDGVVYNEGGEGLGGEHGATYVFYNLEKIGTYESWQERV